jgi:hypothetical protein
MLLLLMSPQLLETAIPISTIVGTAWPEAVVLDAEMDGFHVALEVTLTRKRLTAHSPSAGCALVDREAEWGACIGQVVWGSWEWLHASSLP